MRIYTVGYSSRSLDDFTDLLLDNRVAAVADVRSQPSSQVAPHFNQHSLKHALEKRRIRYVFLGRELGARPKSSKYYERASGSDSKPRVSFKKLAKAEAFKQGLYEVFEIAREMEGEHPESNRRLALMGTERDPINCHRMILVARELLRHYDGIEIEHIRWDRNSSTRDDDEELRDDDMTSCEPHMKALERLLDHLGIQQTLFDSPEGLIERALDEQARRIAHTVMRVMTIGFTKTTAEAFFETLKQQTQSGFGLKRVVDVRLNNVSQLAGFAKRNHLEYFLDKICGIDDYEHLPELLAPKQEMLSGLKKHGGSWADYEKAFLELMSERQIEKWITPERIDGACLLCSEHQPDNCHRRLVVEYLQARWDSEYLQARWEPLPLEIVHLDPAAAARETLSPPSPNPGL